MSIIRLEKLLKSGAGGALEKIIRRAQNMDELTTGLRACLPDGAQSELLAANVRDDGELVLICSSPGWAARLRFESSSLIEAARALGAEVTTCRVKVGTGPRSGGPQA